MKIYYMLFEIKVSRQNQFCQLKEEGKKQELEGWIFHIQEQILIFKSTVNKI